MLARRTACALAFRLRLLALSLPLFTAPAVHAQCEMARLVPANPVDAFGFGWTVALNADGTRAAVNLFRQEGGYDHGFVSIWELNDEEWTEVELLASPSGQPEDFFGACVALSADGDLLAVGAPWENLSAEELDQEVGAIYVFARTESGWVQEGRLVASETWPGQLLGSSLSLSDDGSTLIAGGLEDHAYGLWAGAIFVFCRDASGWIEQAKLRPADAGIGDGFAKSVAISGDGQVAVGSSEQSGGVVFAFERLADQWQFAAKLPVHRGETYGSLGEGAALSHDGRVMLLGMSMREAAQVFVHDGDTWQWEATLTTCAFKPEEAHTFGEGIALSADGNTALIGSGEIGPSARSGAVVYQRRGGVWLEQAIARPSVSVPYDYFGYRLALSRDGDTALIGAWRGLSEGFTSGAAHVFRGIQLIDCNGNAISDSCDILAGTAQDKNGDGFLDECESDCNRNGEPDHAEIESGAASDCNGNWVPDACDLAAATAFDCNGNSIPDTCEILRFEPYFYNDEHDFGYSTAMDGRLIVIGAPLAGQYGRGVIIIYRFDAGRWRRDYFFQPDDLEWSDYYGGAVAVCGDTVVSGAFLHGESGAAYVHRLVDDQWVQEAKLLPPAGTSPAAFGKNVAAAGDIAVIGADRDDEAALDAGAVYIFRRSGSTWQQVLKLLPTLPHEDGSFGSAIAFDGRTLVVGAQREGASSEGAVYVFRDAAPSQESDAGAWSLQQRLVSPVPVTNGKFGAAVDVKGEMVLVGSNAGCAPSRADAHVFSLNGNQWVHEAPLILDDPEATTGAVTAVALGDDLALLGTRCPGGLGSSGAVLVFEKVQGLWRQQTILRSPDPDEGDRFPSALALEKNRLLVGASGQGGCSSGAAFLLPLDMIDCNGNGRCDAFDITHGASRDDDGDGVPDECQQPVHPGTQLLGGLLSLLERWGACDRCPEDLNHDAFVDADDLRLLLSTAPSQ